MKANDSLTSSRTTQILPAAVVTPLRRTSAGPTLLRRSALLIPLKRRSPSPKVRVSLSSPSILPLNPFLFSLIVDISKLDKTPEGLAIWPPLPAAASAPQVPNEVSRFFPDSSSNLLIPVRSSLAPTASSMGLLASLPRPPPDAPLVICALDGSSNANTPSLQIAPDHPSPFLLPPVPLLSLLSLSTSPTRPSARSSLSALMPRLRARSPPCQSLLWVPY